MKYLMFCILVLTGCSASEKALVISAPAPAWVNKMETFCAHANSEIESRTITALTHRKFKCYDGTGRFYYGDYSCEGHNLQYRVICKNGAVAKLSYMFGNADDIILEISNSKQIKKLLDEKDFQ